MNILKKSSLVLRFDGHITLQRPVPSSPPYTPALDAPNTYGIGTVSGPGIDIPYPGYLSILVVATILDKLTIFTLGSF